MHDLFTATIPNSNPDQFFTCLEDTKKNIITIANFFPERFRDMSGIKVIQCLVVSNHIVLLFENGRICFLYFSVTDVVGHRKSTSSPVTSSPKRQSHDSYQRIGLPGFLRSHRYGIQTVAGASSRRDMEVPEELITTAQNILQRPRIDIIRELRLTNLDVNMAINNILSRDNNVSGVFGNPLLSENDSIIEIMPRYPQSRIRAPEILRGADSRRSIRTQTNHKVEESPEDCTTSKLTFSDSVVFLEGEVEYFQDMAAMFSCLLLVGRDDGRLYTLECNSMNLSCKSFPRVEALGLGEEDIVMLAASDTRAACLTRSGKIASWMDDCFEGLGERAEHPATLYTQLEGEKVVKLCCSSSQTIVLTGSGHVYWWGIKALGNAQIDKMIESPTKDADNKISVGSRVYTKDMSLFVQGALVFCPSGDCGTPPKIGYAVDKFCPKGTPLRIRPLDSSLNSSTPSHQGKKRPASKSCVEDDGSAVDLSSTFILRSSPVHSYFTVVLVDNGCALVRLGKVTSSDEHDQIVKLSDLELINCMRTYKRFLSPIQKYPTPLKLASLGKVYSVTQTNGNLHILGDIEGRPHYARLRESDLTKHAIETFMSPMGVESLQLVHCPPNMPAVIRTVIDGSIRFFPTTPTHSANFSNYVKLPATSCVGAGTISTNNGNSTVLVFVHKKCYIMPFILGSDHKSLKQILDSFKTDITYLEDFLSSLLTERLDGNRNVLHVAIMCCKPRSDARVNSSREGEADYISGLFSEEGDVDVTARLADPLQVLHLLCSNAMIRDVVTNLLGQKDFRGFTPIMSALIEFAYEAALVIIENFGNDAVQLRDSFLECENASPLHVICQNDPCTYNWTSSSTVHQTIYECRTCRIVKNYCCCANCAMICHRGHDCSVSRDYLLGFCDCQFEGKCRALDVGSRNFRMEVFKRLLSIDGVENFVDSKGQHILLYVAISLGKNMAKDVEEENKRSSRNNRMAGFVEQIFSLLIFNPRVLESFATTDLRDPKRIDSCQRESGSIDKFSFNFIFKTSKVSIDEFAVALRKIPEECQRRYVRSFVRIYQLLCPHMIFKATYKMDVCQSAFGRIQSLFGNLPALAAKQLIEVGTCLLSHMLMGVVISDKFSINDYKEEKTVLAMLENIFNDNSRTILTDAQPGPRDEAAENLTSVRYRHADLDVENITSHGEDSDDVRSGDDLNPGTRIDDLIAQLEAYGDENISCDFDDFDEPSHLPDVSHTSAGSGLDDIEIVEVRSDDDDQDNDESESDWSSSNSMEMDAGVPSVDGLVADNQMWVVDSDQPSGGRDYSFETHMKNSAYIYYSYIYSIMVVDAAQLMALTRVVCSLEESRSLQESLCSSLEEIWTRVMSVFNYLESKIIFGMDMWDSSHPPGKSESKNDESSSESLKDTLTRMLELLRSQSNEQFGQMPAALNLGSYLHYAYFFDSIAYFYQVLQKTVDCFDQTPYARFFEGVVHVEDSGSKRPFFRRSNSVSCFSKDYGDILDTDVNRALPIAVMPHLLTPLATKDVLFGEGVKLSLDSTVRSDRPIDLRLSFHNEDSEDTNSEHPKSISLPHILKKFRHTIDLFAQLHLDHLDKMPHSTICQFSRFRAKDQRFRSRMSAMPYKNSRSLTFEVERDSRKMMIEVFSLLNELATREGQRNRRQPMALAKIDITFRNEPGRGEGVVRSFFTLLAEGFKSPENLPQLIISPSKLTEGGDNPNLTREEIRSMLSVDAEPYLPKASSNSGHNSFFHGATYKKVERKFPKAASQITGMLVQIPFSHLKKLSRDRDTLALVIEEASKMLGEDRSSLNRFDDSPLFWEPGKTGVYAPILGKGDKIRLNAFLNVGRVIGLCLLFNRLFPMQFCRHVLKYIVNRQIMWHDFAFYNLALYESLRGLTHLGPQELDDLCLSFKTTVDVNKTMLSVDLKPGSEEPVTVDNVREYVRLYAMFCMVKSSEEALKNIRQGVLEVIPADAFDHMSAEDLSLILCGVRTIDLQFLMSITCIINESGVSNVDSYMAWFWNIVEKMEPSDKHDLLYFWTSSPFLPSSNDGFPAIPSISIRPAEDNRFPTANTCICRLYIPLYSTKAVLKSKLHYSIGVKTFGFI